MQRHYGYVGPGDDSGTFSIEKGQVISGYPIGIMLLNVWYPLLPGNVVNAYTYDFPVRMRVVPGSNQERMHSGDPSLLNSLVDTAKELILEGCRAICGACGYFGHFQRQVADAVDVPVFLSSLLQINWIKSSLARNKKIGLICADKPSLTTDIWESCNVDPDNCVIEEIPRGGEFEAILHSKRGAFENQKIRMEVVGTAEKIVREHPEVGAILLECSDMPPYAADVQKAVNLPVFDFITMIKYAHSAVAQRKYQGFI